MFSSSDEHETALISERRAQGRDGGRYGPPHGLWPVLLFVGIALIGNGDRAALALSRRDSADVRAP